MKAPVFLISLCALASLAIAEEKAAPEDPRAVHQEGSEKVAEEQDELSADVEQLVLEQTAPKVIELLGKVEDIMDEATEKLAEADTGADTIAAQTEIIELIHAAAKERQSDGGGQAGGAMMDMMERMMGKEPGGQQEPKPGDKESDDKKGGGGVTGESDTANGDVDGATGGNREIRRIPKAAGSTKAEIPEEFRKAFDAYNRGAEKKAK
jgi:hypothetical protein